MPTYAKSGHEVDVSGEEEVARYEAAGYSLVRRTAEPDKAPDKAAAKPRKK